MTLTEDKAKATSPYRNHGARLDDRALLRACAGTPRRLGWILAQRPLAYLARAGLQTQVVERPHIAGECTATEEMAPGVWINRCHCDHIFLYLTPIPTDLELERGLDDSRTVSGTGIRENTFKEHEQNARPDILMTMSQIPDVNRELAVTRSMQALLAAVKREVESS